jgi:uncharacterized membrane protein YeaQ/YmgE (transglycosylase-associated protein family)
MTMNMSIIGWIVLGLIAGIIAKSLRLGSHRTLRHQSHGGFFDLSTWLVAIAGSVVLLLIYYAITNGSRSRSTSFGRFRRSRR